MSVKDGALQEDAVVTRTRKAPIPVRKALHRLVDELSDSELDAARRYLEYLRNVGGDPVLQALMEAPLDDEPETKEEAAAVREAREQYARGEVRTWEQVREELARE